MKKGRKVEEEGKRRKEGREVKAGKEVKEGGKEERKEGEGW